MEFIFRSLQHDDIGHDPYFSQPDRAEQPGMGSQNEPPPGGAYERQVPSDRPYQRDDEATERPVHVETGVLKVSAKSRPSAVAGAIAGLIRTTQRAEVQAIGAGATNQAIKAVAIAREYLHEDGYDIVAIPAFIDVMIANEERTAIRLLIEPR